MTLRPLVVSIVAALTIPSVPLSAQRIEQSHVAVHKMQTEAKTPAYEPMALNVLRRRPSTGAMVAGGIVGGAIGLVAGAGLGYEAETAGGCADDWFCGLGGAIIGGLLGEALGVPIGVNAVAKRRGKDSRSILTSMLVSVLGIAGAVPTVGFSMLLVPPVQIYTSVRIARSSN